MEQHLAHQFEQLVEVLGGRRRNQPRHLRAAATPGMPAGFIRLVEDGASSTATLGLRCLSITMAGSPFFNFQPVARRGRRARLPPAFMSGRVTGGIHGFQISGQRRWSQ